MHCLLMFISCGELVVHYCIAPMILFHHTYRVAAQIVLVKSFLYFSWPWGKRMFQRCSWESSLNIGTYRYLLFLCTHAHTHTHTHTHMHKCTHVHTHTHTYTHSIQFLRHIRDFFQLVYKVEGSAQELGLEESEEPVTRQILSLSCIGIGFSNFSKGIL